MVYEQRKMCYTLKESVWYVQVYMCICKWENVRVVGLAYRVDCSLQDSHTGHHLPQSH